MRLLPPRMRVVLYEGEGALPLQPALRAEILRRLLDAGYSAARSAAAASPAQGFTYYLGRFVGEAAPLRQAAGQPELLRAAGIEGLAPEEIVGLVDAARDELQQQPEKPWKPWFPVIDYDRCTNCMQCLSFCLFDVYGVDEGKIQVRNQSNCKTDCPACSRVCPEVAILFPKYRAGPINGDEIDPEDLRRESMKVDISALLGGDIYQMLRDRSTKAKSRFSKERDEERAMKERQRCLAQMQKALDIPPEVIASLIPGAPGEQPAPPAGAASTESSST